MFNALYHQKQSIICLINTESFLVLIKYINFSLINIFLLIFLIIVISHNIITQIIIKELKKIIHRDIYIYFLIKK